jgi:hypothetical protein
MHRLGLAVLLGLVLLVAVVLASALAGAAGVCAATAGVPCRYDPTSNCERADGREPRGQERTEVVDGVLYLCGDY